MRLLLKLLIIFVCFSTILQSSQRFAFAKEDEIDDEVVEVPEEAGEQILTEETTNANVKETGSVNTDLYLLFTKPTFSSNNNIELPAGKQVEFLIGFANKASIEYTIDILDASFRYPQDFSYPIQNFTTIKYDRNVAAGQHATLSYAFVPADSFTGRSFGLSINLAYRDEFGATFYESVYNETVKIIEVDEGLDGETFFLYVFMVAIFILLLVIGQQFLSNFGKKHVGPKKSNVTLETGTKKKNDIDYDWVPPHLMKAYSKSPKVNKGAKAANKSPSPKPRKVNRTAGHDD